MHVNYQEHAQLSGRASVTNSMNCICTSVRLDLKRQQHSAATSPFCSSGGAQLLLTNKTAVRRTDGDQVRLDFRSLQLLVTTLDYCMHVRGQENCLSK